MEFINIIFTSNTGRSIHARFHSNFTLDDFVNCIRDRIGALDTYCFRIARRSLNLFDESVFNTQKNLITDNCTIYVATRPIGGCFLPETLVTCADNSHVSISTVQPGDNLLSFTNTGEIVTTTVQEVFVRNVDDYTELQVGGDRTVSVTPDHWIYAGDKSFVQLENLRINDSLFVLSNAGNDLSAEPITALKPVAASSIRVYNLHTAEPHTYFANGIAVHNMSGNMGVSFVDVGNESGLQHLNFSNTAPRWRMVAPGLCLEGKCLNVSCIAYQQQVIINIKFKQFDVLADATAETSKCPICLQYVEPRTCGFNKCLWRWWGIKKPRSGLPPVEIPPCHWKEVGNTYDRFDEQNSGSVIWLKLILEAKDGSGHFT